MSFGPPKDGRPYMPAPKRLHRLAERFPRQIDEARRDKRRDALAAKLTANTTSTSSGLSWLDALLYERLFTDKVVPFAPVVASSSTALDCVDPDGYWCPSVATLERLVDVLDAQETLRQRCVSAILKRNALLEVILQTTCFAARQHETREREYKRSVVAGLQSSSSGDGFPLQQHHTTSSSDYGSFRTSPSSSPLRGRGTAAAPLTVLQLWPNDITRQFLQRVTVSGFQACHLPKPHVNCSHASHMRLAELLQQLDTATDDVVSGVILWRMHLSRPLPFIYGGHNMMLMIQNELETLVTSMTSHLTEHAGGQAAYNAKDCPFHYISRYAGGTGGGGGPMDSSRRHHMSIMQLHVAKTLAYTVSRELTVQMKLVEDGARLAQERGMHIPPLGNYTMPATTATAPVGTVLAAHPTTTVTTPVGGAATPSGKQKGNKSFGNVLLPPLLRGLPTTTAAVLDAQHHSPLAVTLPSFVLEARGDPSAIRKHVMRLGTPLVSLPIIVRAPKKWFDKKHSASLEPDDDDDNGTNAGGPAVLSLLEEMRRDLEIARAVAANGGMSLADGTGGTSMSISIDTSARAALGAPGMSPSHAAGGVAAAAAALMAGRSMSTFAGVSSMLLPPISPMAASGGSQGGSLLRHPADMDGTNTSQGVARRRCIPPYVEDSAYLPVVVVDHNGFVTNGGLHFLLHREVDREGPLVLQRTRQWLRECYTQGRMILEEPFGSVVEPHMQQAAFERREAEAMVQEEAQAALQEGREAKPVRELLRSRRNRSVVPVEDFGTDTKLDKLVLVAYQGGAAVRTPPPGAARVSSPPASPLIGAADTAAGNSTDAAIMEDEESLKRLVMLQRRSVKRFGLRILRAWLRFHMHQVHRNEITTDLLEKNTAEWLRRRFATWMTLTMRRQSARKRADALQVTMELRLLRRRFATWKVVLLSRAVAKNFNQWLYHDAYFRWLYLVLKKRVDTTTRREESDSGSGRPYLSAMAQIESLVGRHVTTGASSMAMLASMPRRPPTPPVSPTGVDPTGTTTTARDNAPAQINE